MCPFRRQYTIREPIKSQCVTYFRTQLLSISETPDQGSLSGGGAAYNMWLSLSVYLCVSGRHKMSKSISFASSFLVFDRPLQFQVAILKLAAVDNLSCGVG